MGTCKIATTATLALLLGACQTSYSDPKLLPFEPQTLVRGASDPSRGPDVGHPVVVSPSPTTVKSAPSDLRWHSETTLLRVSPQANFAVTRIGTAAGALRGSVRWFATGPNGVAAAGPRLRAAMGSRWRHQLVKVTVYGKSRWVRLSDWCACGSGSIIDLPDEVFAKLDPRWHGRLNNSGVLPVIVTWGIGQALPATDTDE